MAWLGEWCIPRLLFGGWGGRVGFERGFRDIAFRFAFGLDSSMAETVSLVETRLSCALRCSERMIFGKGFGWLEPGGVRSTFERLQSLVNEN